MDEFMGHENQLHLFMDHTMFFHFSTSWQTVATDRDEKTVIAARAKTDPAVDKFHTVSPFHQDKCRGFWVPTKHELDRVWTPCPLISLIVEKSSWPKNNRMPSIWKVDSKRTRWRGYNYTEHHSHLVHWCKKKTRRSGWHGSLQNDKF